METRKWTDQSGNDKYTTEVIIPRFGGVMTFLSGRGEESGGGGGGYQPRERSSEASSKPSGGNPTWDSNKGGGDLDDEIPF